MQTIERDQHTGVLQGLIVFHHRLHPLGIEFDVRRRGLVAERDHQHHESHGGIFLGSTRCHSGARESENPESRGCGERFRVQSCGLHRNDDYFLPACARRRSSCSRSSGVKASPKSSAENTWRISISAPPSNGARFIHSMASSSDLALSSQKPATKSLVSGNGPRVALPCPP